jgi:hypothetical protein
MDSKTPWPNLWSGIMQRLRLGSVLDSPLAVIIVIGTVLAIAILINPPGYNWLIPAIFGLLAIILLIFFCVYIYWTFKDPDKLRSSEHEIRKLEISHSLGSSGHILPEVSIDSLPAELNTDANKLQAKHSKQEK